MLMPAKPQATGTSRTSIGQRFDPRRNSLNFLRLMFALVVLVGHAATLGGYSWQLSLIHSPLQDIAVNGFFAISGYLITASALRSNTVRYLWQRVLRIFPGYWVCLVTVAFGFGIVGWLHDHANLSGYFGGPDGACSWRPSVIDVRSTSPWSSSCRCNRGLAGPIPSGSDLQGDSACHL